MVLEKISLEFWFTNFSFFNFFINTFLIPKLFVMLGDNATLLLIFSAVSQHLIGIAPKLYLNKLN